MAIPIDLDGWDRLRDEIDRLISPLRIRRFLAGGDPSWTEAEFKVMGDRDESGR